MASMRDQLRSTERQRPREPLDRLGLGYTSLGALPAAPPLCGAVAPTGDLPGAAAVCGARSRPHWERKAPRCVDPPGTHLRRDHVPPSATPAPLLPWWVRAAEGLTFLLGAAWLQAALFGARTPRGVQGEPDSRQLGVALSRIGFGY